LAAEKLQVSKFQAWVIKRPGGALLRDRAQHAIVELWHFVQRTCLCEVFDQGGAIGLFWAIENNANSPLPTTAAEKQRIQNVS
jgi:hypothetical protein